MNVTDSSPNNPKYFRKLLIVLCLAISITLVVIYTFALLHVKMIRIWRNRSLSSSADKEKVSAKTRENPKRRPTYKEKINSVYMQWTPAEYTSV